MSQYELPLGMSLTNQCYDCMQMDSLCDNCQDLADARLADRAHELVDEGNLQYARPWFATTEPSAHDWVAPITALVRPAHMPDGTIRVERNEYLPPITNLLDGGVYEELWELDDMRQRARETECQWCHLLTPKAFNDCQACDKPLELNVR
jgi:hypothetical protein